jgi:DNA-binding transcriptional MerR regulator
MRRTVKQMAKASGISVRMLHHYDAIGLLAPAEIGANGYRYYGQAELLRLQQILFYRELGFQLATIRSVLDDPRFALETALLAHRDRLGADIARYRRLIRTIDRTVEILRQETSMADDKFFEGFSTEKQTAWEAELRARFGPEAEASFTDAKERMTALDADGRKAVVDEVDALHAAFACLAERRVPPAAPEAQALTARHHAWVCRSWTPTAEAYAGLGRLYVEHPDFRATFDAVRPGLGLYLAQAMACYAETTLSPREC